MTIAAVIVTHNRLDRLRTGLARTFAEPFDHIIVVNCASTDGTQAYLETLADQRLEVMHTETNIGGAGGFNVGMTAATKIADWVVLFDDDAWPVSGALDQFKHLRRTTNASAIAARVEFPDGQLCEFNRPARNPFWRVRSFVRTLSQGPRPGMYLTDAEMHQTAAPTEIDFSSFVGLFVKSQAINDVGPPDPDLFIYGDDTSFCLRLRRGGHRIVAAPQIRFIHDCPKWTDHMVFLPLWKVYYITRNAIGSIKLAAGPAWFFPALIYSITLWICRARLYPPTHRRTYLRLLFIGLMDGLRGRLGRKPAIHDTAAPSIALTGARSSRLVGSAHSGEQHASEPNFSRRRSVKEPRLRALARIRHTDGQR